MRLKVATALVTLAAALAGIGCGDDNKIDAKAKKDFVKGCTDAGQPQEGCTCVFDELKKQGIDTKKKFENLADDVKKGKITDEFRQAALNCKDKLTTQ